MIELISDTYYSVNDFDLITNYIETKTSKTQKQIEYYNLICAFDIETTSFTIPGQEIIRDENLYNHIKGSKIKVNDAELIKKYKNKLFPYVIFANNGIELDVFYDELINEYSFPKTIDPVEQLDIIYNAIQQNKPQTNDDQKCSIMYVWQFALNGHVFIGRTWHEFLSLISKIVRFYDTNMKRRIIIYVHNLGMEFQYLRKLFEWSKVFSNKPRSPLFAITTEGIEFRCSYMLSGYSLAKVADNLLKYDIKKLVGDLDYTLPRHSKTPLSQEELNYCINDVLIVSAYIQECILTEGDITRIPLTATGYCRNYVRHQCLKTGGKKKRGKTFNRYHGLMQSLRIQSSEEYSQLTRAFGGGFTHASCLYSGQTMSNVDSIDETSAYPFVMLSEMVPMSVGVLKCPETYEEFCYYNKIYCTVFDITFYDLKPVFIDDNYISSSKCLNVVNAVINNGRVVSADQLTTTITNIDFRIIEKTYSWSKIKINNFRCYRKGYIPKSFIKAIIKLYQDKTTLKGVDGKEEEYMHAKALLNSLYGLSAQKPCTPLITYDNDEWGVEPLDINKELGKHNNSAKRVTFYAWAPFITAYARYNLWCAILEFSKTKDGISDYIYCDTDSIKCTRFEDHKGWVDKYNELCAKKLKLMCKHYDIDYNELLPRTIKGEIKPLGVWDWETINEKYKQFKTLGAKRYIYSLSDGIHCTVAGVSKKHLQSYMMNEYGVEQSFNEFNEGLNIPPEHTGKLIHYYIDQEIKGYITDYLGNEIRFVAPSGIYFEKAPYYFDISASYIDYLKGIQHIK